MSHDLCALIPGKLYEITGMPVSVFNNAEEIADHVQPGDCVFYLGPLMENDAGWSSGFMSRVLTSKGGYGFVMSYQLSYYGKQVP